MSAMGTFPYDMTVIVPVYNAEAYLLRCVASLDAQTMPQDRIEVVLVNDGSRDNSPELCKEVVAARPNYMLIDQENQGVSSARNAGIGAARGRYLMFLDPDDELTSPSIAALVETFDQMGEQVDLLTFPLSYHEASSGYVHQHKRQTWLTKTGVYDLNEFPFIAQTTVNVCVRNQGKETPRFDESLRLCEDQRFNTDILASKAAIGYCAEATYVYWRYDGTSAATRHLSKEAFAGIVHNYGHFIDLAEEHVRFARYAYALVIYDTSWRIRQHELLPHDVDDAARAQCQQQMDEVLARIPRRAWLESPYLSDTMRIYQLRRYERLGTVEDVSYNENGTTLRMDDGEELQLEPPSVVIDWLLRRPDHTILKGFVYGPSCFMEGKPSLSITVKGKAENLELVPSRCDDEHTGISFTKAWRFEATLPPMTKSFDVTFGLSFGERDVPSIKLAFDLQRCNGRLIDSKKREFRDRRAIIKGQALHVGTIKDLPAWTMPIARLAMQRREEKRPGNYDHELVASLRARLPKAVAGARRHCVWLYDGGSHGTEEELSQLLEAYPVPQGVVACCVVDSAEETRRVQTLGYEPVQRDSFEHLVAFLIAKVVITAVEDMSNLRPYGNAVFDRVSDYARKQRFVLLSEHPESARAEAFDECR